MGLLPIVDVFFLEARHEMAPDAHVGFASAGFCGGLYAEVALVGVSALVESESVGHKEGHVERVVSKVGQQHFGPAVPHAVEQKHLAHLSRIEGACLSFGGFTEPA